MQTQHALELRGRVCEQALGHVGAGLGQQLVPGIRRHASQCGYSLHTFWGVHWKYNSITKHQHAPQLGGGVGEQALGHVGVGLGQQLVLGVGRHAS